MRSNSLSKPVAVEAVDQAIRNYVASIQERDQRATAAIGGCAVRGGKVSLFLTVLLVLVASAVSAFAETQEDRFAKIDANGDGAVSYEEHAASVDAEFGKIDASNTGSITVNQYAAWLAKEPPGWPPAVALSVARCYFKIVDADRDGRILASEYRGYNDRVFNWLAGEDRRMTLVESKRVPPSNIVPSPVCR